MNVTGVIITTNYKADSMYLPADDRRHYVAWCDLTKEDFNEGYWETLWNWYADGGLEKRQRESSCAMRQRQRQGRP